MADFEIVEEDNHRLVLMVRSLGTECKVNHILSYERAVEFHAKLGKWIKQLEKELEEPKDEGFRLVRSQR